MPTTRKPSDFGKALKAARKAAGNVSQQELATQIGLHMSSIARYESGEVKPTLDVIVRMCHALRITPNELLAYALKAHKKPKAAA